MKRSVVFILCVVLCKNVLCLIYETQDADLGLVRVNPSRIVYAKIKGLRFSLWFSI